MEEQILKQLAQPLLAWYDIHRRILPWREEVSPYRTWVSEIMLQQTRVAAVLPYFQRFMEAFPTVEALAQADVSEVEESIHSTGVFRAKARDIVAASQMLLAVYGGPVPSTMEELLMLPGVGRKTANLILGDIFQAPGAVVADTHCIRISGRLGLTDGTKEPPKVEQQLRAQLPPEESNDFCHRLVLHGRAVCMARKPDCANCTLRPWCDFYQPQD